MTFNSTCFRKPVVFIVNSLKENYFRTFKAVAFFVLLSFCNVKVHAQQCEVLGDAEVCPGDISVYNVDLSGCGSTPGTYLWFVSGDGTISGSNSNNTVTVIWGGTGGGNVSVTVSGVTTNPAALNVQIVAAPDPVVTTDVDLVCIVYREDTGEPVDEECFQVCEHSTSTFTVQNNPSSTYS